MSTTDFAQIDSSVTRNSRSIHTRSTNGSGRTVRSGTTRCGTSAGHRVRRGRSPSTTTRRPGRTATRLAGRSSRCRSRSRATTSPTIIEEHRDELPFSDQLPSFDPPKHTAHRGLLMRLITPKRLKENEDFMWELADETIDGFIDTR